MNSANPHHPLSLKEKIGYGLGDMASNFYLGFFGLFLLYYYTDVYGLAPAAVGLMLLISKIVDAVTDPGMGLISDRTESRWGKYRPYLLFGAIPYGLLGIAIFYGPDLSDNGKLIYAYVTYIGVMLAFTLMNVPYSALLAVISPSAEERTKATTFRLAFAGAGGLLVAAFATPLSTWLGGGDDVLGFRLTIIVFAILSVLLFWITFATTKERIRPPKHDNSVVKDFGILTRNKSWVALALACVVILIGLVARFASVIYYVKYYMGDADQIVFLIFDRVAVFNSAGMLGQVVGAASVLLLIKQVDKHHLVFMLSIVHAILLAISFFIPPEWYGISVFIHFLGIATFGGTITLMFAMFTDCAEYGEWKTGKRISGLTVSASMFALKFGSAIGGAIPGFILGGIGFVANEVQTEDVIFGIRLMSTLLPAALFLGGSLFMLRYRIDRVMLAQMEHELKQQRPQD